MSADQKSYWQIGISLVSRRFRSMEQGPKKRTRWSPLSPGRMLFWACVLLLTIGIGVGLRAEIHRRVSRFGGTVSGTYAHRGGTLLIVGGGQMSDMIRQQFVELAGRQQARIVVVPAMAIDENERLEYREPWCNYDVQAVDVLHADSRAEADDPDFSAILDSATGVWLAGGQQSWLAARYGRTPVETRLKKLLSRNGVIGGTSAGAAIMSNVMIAGGRANPLMGQGFDLIPGAIIDQHFMKRNRYRRLHQALEQHPELIGFGIDEGTALRYGVESGRFRVIGQSCVVACIPPSESNHYTSFHLEFLNPGDEFDVERLRQGEMVPPSSIDLDAILPGE